MTCKLKTDIEFEEKPEELSRYSDGLRAGRLGVRFPAGARDFSLLCSIKTGSGAQYRDPSPRRGKRLGREVYHSFPSSTEINKE
jgi:hypothetical protein